MVRFYVIRTRFLTLNTKIMTESMEMFCRRWLGLLDMAMTERRLKRQVGRITHMPTDRITRVLQGRGLTLTLVHILVTLTWQLERDEFDELLKGMADSLWEFSRKHNVNETLRYDNDNETLALR